MQRPCKHGFSSHGDFWSCQLVYFLSEILGLMRRPYKLWAIIIAYKPTFLYTNGWFKLNITIPATPKCTITCALSMIRTNQGVTWIAYPCTWFTFFWTWVTEHVTIFKKFFHFRTIFIFWSGIKIMLKRSRSVFLLFSFQKFISNSTIYMYNLGQSRSSNKTTSSVWNSAENAIYRLDDDGISNENPWSPNNLPCL